MPVDAGLRTAQTILLRWIGTVALNDVLCMSFVGEERYMFICMSRDNLQAIIRQISRRIFA
jgi:hypothetical protein